MKSKNNYFQKHQIFSKTPFTAVRDNYKSFKNEIWPSFTFCKYRKNYLHLKFSFLIIFWTIKPKFLPIWPINETSKKFKKNEKIDLIKGTNWQNFMFLALAFVFHYYVFQKFTFWLERHSF